MGFFNLFAKGDPGPDINEVSAWLKGPAVLLDVRDPQEYAAGHLPGSINLPVSELSRIRELAPDLTAPVFVYCLTGNRSRRAVRTLKNMGYANVRNVGGIRAYKGPLERRK